MALVDLMITGFFKDTETAKTLIDAIESMNEYTDEANDLILDQVREAIENKDSEAKELSEKLNERSKLWIGAWKKFADTINSADTIKPKKDNQLITDCEKHLEENAHAFEKLKCEIKCLMEKATDLEIIATRLKGRKASQR